MKWIARTIVIILLSPLLLFIAILLILGISLLGVMTMSIEDSSHSDFEI